MRRFVSFVASFFKKQEKNVLEKLEDIEDEILSLENARTSSLDSEKRFVFRLVVYSLIFFGMSFIFSYYYYWPTSQRGKAFMYTSLVVYPLIVSLLKWVMKRFFLRRISKTDNCLRVLREAKQQLLEEVMEKETFKKAQQILKRFDPLMFASLSALDNIATETPRIPSHASFALGTDTRLKSHKGFADGDNRSLLINTPLRRMTTESKSISERELCKLSTPGQTESKATCEPLKPQLLRPILPRERTVVDRLIDALVGDGPDKRYALICQECSSHNGMALQEEFEYLAFRCCYCAHFNPPRRARRLAPIPSNIAQSVPHLAFTCPPPAERDLDEDSSIKRRVSVPASLTNSHSPTMIETNGDDFVAEHPEEFVDTTINGDAEGS
ncbi:Lunapark [Fasciola hepatica]|uniref:Endoplasmic reticulum junction formation protein lunapark n=1 Tax=Fasciola hepatica TaxID=6192 RepID=A0A4E0RU37_FASHE|nr:Lunapark [Fasciola hepatica]